MVNTTKSQDFWKESDSGQIAPHDDAYTGRDGHFPGHDGFIVPNSFNFVRRLSRMMVENSKAFVESSRVP
jgi:hypothetical protein